ncbi:alpha/beta hydrolase [Hutsoniella sourekii]
MATNKWIQAGKGLLLASGLVSMSTLVIGNLFVDYALVPGNGGQDRDVDEEGSSTRFQSKIDQAQEAAFKEAQDWRADLQELAPRVEIQSRSGLYLRGQVFKQVGKSHRWMIIVHGYQVDQEASLALAHQFYLRGYNVLIYDQRAHGLSEGTYITMGQFEQSDLLEWTRYVISLDKRAKIIYHGTSMGGATVLMASGKPLPKQVKAIISDCGYSKTWDIMALELKKRFNLTAFPFLEMARLMARLRIGIDLKDIQPIREVRKSRLPILFVHTEPDSFVPVEMAKDLYLAKRYGAKEIYLIPEGQHAQAPYTPHYYERLESFIDKYI